MKNSFYHMKRFRRERFLVYVLGWLCKSCSNRSKHYSWYLQQCEDRVTKAMDLKKFITSHRMQATALFGLLSGKQNYLVERISQMVMMEENCLARRQFSDEDDDEDEQSNSAGEWCKDELKAAEKIAFSRDPIDRRFLKVYMFNRAARFGLSFGFNNDFLLSRRIEHSGEDREQEDPGELERSPGSLASRDQMTEN